jgi:hypothetical protein
VHFRVFHVGPSSHGGHNSMQAHGAASQARGQGDLCGLLRPPVPRSQVTLWLTANRRQGSSDNQNFRWALRKSPYKEPYGLTPEPERNQTELTSSGPLGGTNEQPSNSKSSGSTAQGRQKWCCQYIQISASKNYLKR